MELWIRSQNKTKLTFNPKLYIDRNGGIFEAINNVKGDLFLGKYETKERALEVLDEIQNILKPKTLITDCGNPIECSDGGFVYLNQKTKLEYSEVGTYVYEMPQE